MVSVSDGEMGTTTGCGCCCCSDSVVTPSSCSPCWVSSSTALATRDNLRWFFIGRAFFRAELRWWWGKVQNAREGEEEAEAKGSVEEEEEEERRMECRRDEDEISVAILQTNSAPTGLVALDL